MHAWLKCRNWPLITTISGQLAFLTGLALAGCGPVSSSKNSVGTTPVISYALERTHTGVQTNALIFTFPEETEYGYRLSEGLNVNSDASFDEIHPLTSRVSFDYVAEGTYTVDLEMLQYNDVPYSLETLTWVYSTVVPDPPIVSFSELATPDTSITMMIAGSRAQEDNEIWVEGDLGGAYANGGLWAPLAESGILLLETTPEDGLKEMTVKLRNIYGNESDPALASIIKKSVGPTNCNAIMDGTGSARTNVMLQLFADNDGPLFYNVTGDVEFVGDYLPFTSGDYIETRLSSGEGEKRIVVHIRDAASNYCDDIVHSFDVSAGYVGQVLEVDGEPLWTDTDDVDLNIRYDHYPSEAPILMRITGAITDQTQWIPYATTYSATLTPGSGEKQLFAQFKNAQDEESFLISTIIHYQPRVTLVDQGAPEYDVVISKVRGMTNVTITGCAQTYNAVVWAATYDCTLIAADVDVLYTLSDGTSFTKSDAP